MITDDVLTAAETAEFLKIHIVNVRKLAGRVIPGRKVGRDWKFSRAALLRWLDNSADLSESSEESVDHRTFDARSPVSVSMFPTAEEVSKRLQKPPRERPAPDPEERERLLRESQHAMAELRTRRKERATAARKAWEMKRRTAR